MVGVGQGKGEVACLPRGEDLEAQKRLLCYLLFFSRVGALGTERQGVEVGEALLPSNSRILLWYHLGLKEGCSHWHLEGFCPSW